MINDPSAISLDRRQMPTAQPRQHENGTCDPADFHGFPSPAVLIGPQSSFGLDETEACPATFTSSPSACLVTSAVAVMIPATQQKCKSQLGQNSQLNSRQVSRILKILQDHTISLSN